MSTSGGVRHRGRRAALHHRDGLRDLQEVVQGAHRHCPQELRPPARPHRQGPQAEDAHLPADLLLRPLRPQHLHLGAAQGAPVLKRRRRRRQERWVRFYLATH